MHILNKKTKSLISLVIMVLVLVVSWVFAATSTTQPFESNKIFDSKFAEPISSLLFYIDNMYYERSKVDYNKVLDSTLEGLVNGLNDPFCWYFDESRTKLNESQEKSEYGGIGLTTRYDSTKKVMVVISPMAGTPGEAAGIQSEDYILSVDGSPVEKIGYYEAAKKMLGEPGTKVVIEVYRDGWKDTKKVTITRAMIEAKTVKYDVISTEGKQIIYIKLTNFSEKSPEEMYDALNTLKEINNQSPKPFDGFILDLRNNPGGFLQAAEEIASMFIREGKIISLRYYNGQQQDILPIPGKYFGFLNNIPKVVLANKGSASAAEILTGMLKDYKIATVIGKTTYGKAAVQKPLQMSNGGSVWLPIGHYFTPNGTDIHLKGIKPDIETDNPKNELDKDNKISEKDKTEAMLNTTNKIKLDIGKDQQLKRAVEEIMKKIVK